MPVIYLSPSMQPYNKYVNGSDEQTVMNQIADAMEPYLRASGIQFVRNRPGKQTLGDVIRESNAGYYDFHLALHSNAAPPSMAGKLQGTDVYYYVGSSRGRRAADIIAANLKNIYPRSEKVSAVPTKRIVEVTKTNAPAVLIEIAYHDNTEDADWIKGNIQRIAANITQSLCEYFGIPFISNPQPPKKAKVITKETPLNIRAKPTTQSAVITQAQKGQQITVLGEWHDWDVVDVNGVIGYASAQYLQIL